MMENAQVNMSLRTIKRNKQALENGGITRDLESGRPQNYTKFIKNLILKLKTYSLFLT